MRGRVPSLPSLPSPVRAWHYIQHSVMWTVAALRNADLHEDAA